MFPVRCYTCNAVLAHLHVSFVERRKHDSNALDALGVERMCCRRMFLTHVDSLVRNQLAYPNSNRTLDGGVTLLRRCDSAYRVPCD